MAETTGLAVKASRRPNWKSSTAGNPTKGQGGQDQRGGGRSGYFPGRERSGSRGGFGERRGSMVDAGMSRIGDGVELEVVVQALQDLLILRLVMCVRKARPFGPLL